MSGFKFSKKYFIHYAWAVIVVFSLIVSGCSEKNVENSSAPIGQNSNADKTNLGITAEQFELTYNDTLEALSKSNGINLNHLRIDALDRSGGDGIGFILKSAPQNLDLYALYSPENKKYLQVVKIDIPKKMSETDKAALISTANYAATRNRIDDTIITLPNYLVSQPKNSTMKRDGYIFGWIVHKNSFVYEIATENSEYAKRPGNAERYKNTMIENISVTETSTDSTENIPASPPNVTPRETSTPTSNNSSALSLGGIKLNDSIEEMHKILGREDRITPSSTPNHQHYEYRDIVITESGGKIVGLVSYSSAVQTEKGIRQGSTFQQVKDVYGLRCSVNTHEDLILYEYPYDIGENKLAVMRFAVKNNVVDYISLRIVGGSERTDILATVKTI